MSLWVWFIESNLKIMLMVQCKDRSARRNLLPNSIWCTYFVALSLFHSVMLSLMFILAVKLYLDAHKKAQIFQMLFWIKTTQVFASKMPHLLALKQEDTHHIKALLHLLVVAEIIDFCSTKTPVSAFLQIKLVYVVEKTLLDPVTKNSMTQFRMWV